MISIDQLLESVDLDFEPRWVTQNAFGVVAVRSGKKPHPESPKWIGEIREYQNFGKIKLAEFANKHWTECIYEVPKKEEKTASTIEKLKIHETSSGGKDMVLHIQKTPATPFEMHHKINELVDAVNELKAKFALPTLNPDLTDEDLRKMMCDPKYWRDKDSATIQKVQDGFNKLYGDNELKGAKNE